eukprot:45349_1
MAIVLSWHLAGLCTNAIATMTCVMVSLVALCRVCTEDNVHLERQDNVILDINANLDNAANLEIQHNANLKKHIRSITFSAFLSFIILTGSMTIWFSTNSTFGQNNPISIIYGLAWDLGQILKYILIAFLVSGTLKTFPRHQFSDKHKIIFLILITLFGVCIFIAVMSEVIIASQNNPNKQISSELWLSWITGAPVLDFIICVWLITVFIKKMINIAVVKHFKSDLHRHSVHIATDIHVDFDMERIHMNNQQAEVLKIMTKYFILSFILIVSTQIGYFIEAAKYFTKWIMKDKDIYKQIDIYMDVVLFPLYVFINTICLYLTLPMNNEMYEITCGICHKCTVKCFEDITKKGVRRKTNELKEILLQPNDQMPVQKLVEVKNQEIYIHDNRQHNANQQAAGDTVTSKSLASVERVINK